MEYRHLFEPLKIGNLVVPNRMFMPAMHLGMSPTGMPSEDFIEFYNRVSSGGAGMVVIGGAAVNRAGAEPLMLLLYKEQHSKVLSRVVEVIKKNGSVPVVQLFHAGRYAFAEFNGVPAVSSSAVKSPITHQIPEPLSVPGIKQTIEDFVKSARLAVDAGFEAIEIIMSAGYLVNQFLSPAVNRRDDQYGGPFENRIRFAVELIDQLKSEISVPIGIRLSGADMVPGGNPPDIQVEVAKVLVKHGVEWIDVTGGWHESHIPQITFDVPEAGYAFLARLVKEAVDVPVVASNRIRDPEVAENLIKWGYADAVNLGRQLLADPQYPEKLKEGRAWDIRPCLSCNQGCLDKVFSGQAVDCVVNPSISIPDNLHTIKKRVAIVGAGPAGLEAATYLARQNIDVTLYEKSDHIGGQVVLAAAGFGRREFYRLIDYYEAQINHYDNINVQFNTTIDDSRDFERFDALIWTGGAYPRTLEFEGNGEVVTAWDVLSGKVDVGRRVLIVGGGPTGMEVAIHLAIEGAMTPEQLHFHMFFNSFDPDLLTKELYKGWRDVYVVELRGKLGLGIGVSTRWVTLKVANNLGILGFTSSRLTFWDGSTAIIKTPSDDVTLDIDNVVIAAGVVPNKPAFLDDLDIPVEIAGDARAIGDIASAIRSARIATNRLLNNL